MTGHPINRAFALRLTVASAIIGQGFVLCYLAALMVSTTLSSYQVSTGLSNMLVFMLCEAAAFGVVAIASVAGVLVARRPCPIEPRTAAYLGIGIVMLSRGITCAMLVPANSKVTSWLVIFLVSMIVTLGLPELIAGVTGYWIHRRVRR